MYRILLVDDETDVRESIARMIDWDTQGFSLCGCAAGSLEALEMADELLPDVVMTDICMPYIDGLELIRRLRKVHPAMQFVIVSGYDDFSYAQQAVQLHVMDYLLKPFRDQELVAAILRVRQSQDGRTEAPGAQLPQLPGGDKSKYVQRTLEYVAKKKECSISGICNKTIPFRP